LADGPVKFSGIPFGIPQHKRAIAEETYRIISIRVVRSLSPKPSTFKSHPRQSLTLDGQRLWHVFKDIIAVITLFEAEFPMNVVPKLIPEPVMMQIKL